MANAISRQALASSRSPLVSGSPKKITIASPMNWSNSGSNDRMHYTIIGAEANLAARLQSIAEAGQVVISFETYSLVRDRVTATALAPIRMKGFGREVTPWAVEGLRDAQGNNMEVFAAHMPGVDLYIDRQMISGESADSVRAVLQRALDALGEPQKSSVS
jgi:adenylate cyclase